ncbi:MAG: manganese efflux pump MntP family protein [Bacteroidales bacterium]|nr:manganese efflux pump MntP family protein [Bacteroidales bacterium]MDD2322114.1 manganese efflux pump MntP family protein [Bacteroidales bacterium]MDD3010188.1 manganese efflux pump MntP family protein [Bacteroidales bacterium]MDD3961164.1 manganese efflux pump MntP family protein [Bacteroidales bacterium]MDY0286140.1 manganese efflux pump MntP family protein [Bacteroidales bacterium]
MEILTLVIIAIGLSMDSLAVSVLSGFCLQRFKKPEALKIALTLGIFQAGMPLTGWLAGLSFRETVADYDHWIAFGILTVLGIKMLIEGCKQQDQRCFNPLKNRTLITMAVGTSIDALVVGVSFAFLDFHILTAVFLIGLVTLVFSLAGLYIGAKVKFRRMRMEIAGGIILILIGVKIVVEHLNGIH